MIKPGKKVNKVRRNIISTAMGAIVLSLFIGLASPTFLYAEGATTKPAEAKSDPGVQVRTPLRGKWWENQTVKDSLKLTEDQMKKINAEYDTTQAAIKKARTDVQEKRIKVLELLAAKTFDQKAYAVALADYSNAQSKWAKNHLDLKKKIRMILTDAQVEKLLARDDGIFKRPWGNQQAKRGRGQRHRGQRNRGQRNRGQGARKMQGQMPVPPEPQNAAPAKPVAPPEAK